MCLKKYVNTKFTYHIPYIINPCVLIFNCIIHQELPVSIIKETFKITILNFSSIHHYYLTPVSLQSALN